MRCRHCRADLRLPFLDLGTAPYSNAYLTQEALRAPEAWVPLRVLVCTSCWLVQTEAVVAAREVFTDQYAYFSSYSASWLRHAEAYVADVVDRFRLLGSSRVIEIAANDGYLLQYVKARGIPCLGIEPTASTAQAARRKGIEILETFFGAELGARLVADRKQADLVVANNVLAHVPEIDDFLQGIASLLKPSGVVTFEFPHLLRLLEDSQFDTVYHEHFSYLSLAALVPILEQNQLKPFDVETLPTHGGSLRVFAQRMDSNSHLTTARLSQVLTREARAGVTTEAFYGALQGRAELIKNRFLAFLLKAKRARKTVAAYGAAAKGNTLLNFAGIRPDLLPFVADRNPAKQGRYLPGSRIPILPEAALLERKPEFVVILPWNLRDEVVAQLDYIRGWGGRFVTAVPSLRLTKP